MGATLLFCLAASPFARCQQPVSGNEATLQQAIGLPDEARRDFAKVSDYECLISAGLQLHATAVCHAAQNPQNCATMKRPNRVVHAGDVEKLADFFGQEQFRPFLRALQSQHLFRRKHNAPGQTGQACQSIRSRRRT